MKRKAILIGNSNGLSGVKIDLEKFSHFLMSDIGGAWYSNEIETLMNPSKIVLELKLITARIKNYDYVIVLFSGHGGQHREVVLEINGAGETINESDLSGLANRQLNIYDCCRVVDKRNMALDESTKKFAMESASSTSKEYIRLKYDQRIMEAIYQQSSLYACAVDECAYDTPKGAIYLNHLIDAAGSFSSNQVYQLVGNAHDTAAYKTKQEKPEQTPESVLPKCLSSQQLIMSINPKEILTL